MPPVNGQTSRQKQTHISIRIKERERTSILLTDKLLGKPKDRQTDRQTDRHMDG